MVKALTAIAWLSAISLAVVNVPLSAQAQDQPDTRAPGVCGLDSLTGRSVIDASGQLVSLTDYCQQQQTVQTSLGFEGDQFWQTYRTVASPEALAFSNTIDRQVLTDYATTICPFLAGGGTLRDIRRIQEDGALPSSVEVAVTVAAIHSYCPEYTSQIGRR